MTKFLFDIRMIDGIIRETVDEPTGDSTEAVHKLAEKFGMSDAEFLAITAKVYEWKEGKWEKIWE